MAEPATTVNRSAIGQLARSSALYGVAGALGKALALVAVPFLSRSLTPSGYGLADLAASLAALLTLVVMFAGDIPAARLASDRSRDAGTVLRTYVTSTALVSVGASILLIPLATPIASILWGDAGNALLVYLGLLLVPISATQAALVTVQRIVGRPRTFAVLTTVDLLSQLGLAVLLVSIGWGPTGVVAGFVLGSLVGLATAAVSPWSPAAGRFDVRLALDLIREGMPFIPATVLFIAADYVTRVLVLGRLGDTGVGYFAVAVRLASIMSLAVGAFSQAWGPFGLGLQASELTAKFFGRAAVTMLVGLSIAGLLIGAVAPEMVEVISGRAYNQSAGVLEGLLLGGADAGVFFVVLIAAGVSQSGPRVALASAVGSGIQVAAVALLLPWYGFPIVGTACLAGRLSSLVALVSFLGKDRIRLPAGFVVSLFIATGIGVALQWLTVGGAAVTLRIATAALGSAVLLAILYRARS